MKVRLNRMQTNMKYQVFGVLVLLVMVSQGARLRSVTDAPASNYELLDGKANDCSSKDKEIAESDCPKAFAGATAGKTVDPTKYTGSWGHLPYGCVAGFGNNKYYYHWNKRHGNNNGKYHKVCKATSTDAPASNYELLDGKANDCSSKDKEIAESDCPKAFAGATAGKTVDPTKYTGSWGHLPYGCVAGFGNNKYYYHWNKRHGNNNGKYHKVCKATSTDAPASNYELLDGKANDCSSKDKEIAESDCPKAFAGATAGKTVDPTKYTGSWGHLPYGCVAGFGNNKYYYHWNKRHGNNNGKYHKVCKATSTDASASNYELLSDKRANDCSSKDKEPSQSQCATAFASATAGKTVDSKQYTGSWTHVPYGCVAGFANGKYYYHWNNRQGNNNGHYHKICKATSTASRKPTTTVTKLSRETIYKKGIKGTNACEYPMENVPKSKCSEAIKKIIPNGARIGGTYEGNYRSVPAGCNVHSSRSSYYKTFNNIDGTNGGKYTPVCQILPRDYKYRLQGKPGNDCPAGTEEIKDVETCRKAYNEAIGKTAPFLQEWVGAWNHPPPGCSVTVALHPLRMIRYFNKRRGNNNGKFIKICKHKISADPPAIDNGKSGVFKLFSKDSQKKWVTSRLDSDPKCRNPALDNPAGVGMCYVLSGNNKVQMDLKREVTWRIITTSGIPGTNMWIKDYQIWMWTQQGWKFYNFGAKLQANTNDDKQHTNVLDPLLVSSKIELNFNHYHKVPGLRIDAYFTERVVKQNDLMYWPLKNFQLSSYN